MRVHVLAVVLYIWALPVQGQIGQTRVKLTAERGGPPLGAQFMPIPVVNFPIQFAPRPPSRRPVLGRPPPPPVSMPTYQQPRPPKPPTSSSGKPPQPPPVPPPGMLGVPVSSMSQPVPNLPAQMTLGTPPPQLPPVEEPTSPLPPATTTPNTMDSYPALYHRFVQNDDLSYYFDFKSANQISRSEQGFFKRDNLQENPIMVKTGMYAFTSPEGIRFFVDYVADERGYRTFPHIEPPVQPPQ